MRCPDLGIIETVACCLLADQSTYVIGTNLTNGGPAIPMNYKSNTVTVISETWSGATIKFVYANSLSNTPDKR